MKAVKEKYIGESKMKDKPKKRLNLVIAAKSITGRQLADETIESRNIGLGQVMSEHIGKGEVKKDNIGNHEVTAEKLSEDLLNQIQSHHEGGYVMSNEFGNSTLIGISQKTLTQALNTIWKKIGEITGEPVTGMKFEVTPEYFISDEDCPVHITAHHNTGVFERIQFFINGVEIAKAEDVQDFKHDIFISQTSEIKCIAKILGIEYMEKKTVVKYFPFFIGAGTSWESVVTAENSRPYTGNIDGNYDINVKEGDRLYIIIPASIKDQLVRADMNGFEIPFSAINRDRYVIWESLNTYKAGVYNIDIN